MNCYNISSVADMTKKPTERKVSETKKKSKKTNTKTNNNKNNNPIGLSTKDEKSIQIAKVIHREWKITIMPTNKTITIQKR
jgi:hypothetical protein